eukprot:CAMPEP_0119379264 /NCGR_PEP_ID=MMETSP1334-20130426/51902_1 /TAXON_ID=127549 /ORGANISM="Calcidiscus leptoporus, Strain RCC1130" /LENGTH=345 /DNA_ID=CAMNT_0007398721 /DNA_START=384 /DNA_END=1421 /DNA_ORIENTATION=+
MTSCEQGGPVVYSNDTDCVSAPHIEPLHLDPQRLHEEQQHVVAEPAPAMSHAEGPASAGGSPAAQLCCSSLGSASVVAVSAVGLVGVAAAGGSVGSGGGGGSWAMGATGGSTRGGALGAVCVEPTVAACASRSAAVRKRDLARVERGLWRAKSLELGEVQAAFGARQHHVDARDMLDECVRRPHVHAACGAEAMRCELRIVAVEKNNSRADESSSPVKSIVQRQLRDHHRRAKLEPKVLRPPHTVGVKEPGVDGSVNGDHGAAVLGVGPARGDRCDAVCPHCNILEWRASEMAALLHSERHRGRHVAPRLALGVSVLRGAAVPTTAIGSGFRVGVVMSRRASGHS